MTESRVGPVATDPAEFVHALVRLRLWAGQPSLERLRARAGSRMSARGAVVSLLPAATVSEILNGKRLPRLPRLAFVTAFVTACLAEAGCDKAAIAAEVAEWETAWRRLQSPPVRQAGQGGGLAVPRELPAAVAGFVGRQAELRALDGLLEAGTVLVTGTPGVGKTALAVHWARRVAQRFPDGQLYVDLRGYDAGEPLGADAAMGCLLRALEVEQLPPDLDERTRLFQRLLAGRRLLVLLDNVRSPEQVRPLLPRSGGHLVLATSRDSLAGLVARDGAQRLVLGRFSTEQATELLRRLVPEDRVPADPAVREELTRLCAGLPLALRVAAEQLADCRAEELVAALRTADRQLDLLDAGGDAATDVRAVFEWSYRALPASVARLFRLLSLVPGGEFDAYAAANLAGVPLAQARRMLRLLRQRYLVEELRPGRYRFHNLLAAYSAELAEDDDGAREGLIAYYVHTAQATAPFINDLIDLRSLDLAEPGPDPLVPLDGFADAKRASQWLDAERGTLMAAIRIAAADGSPQAWRLAHALRPFYSFRGYQDDWLESHRLALRVAEQRDDRQARAVTLAHLAWALNGRGRRAAAIEHLRLALEAFRGLGQRPGEALVLTGLSDTLLDAGRPAEAVPHYQEAHALCQEIGDLTTGALARLGLGRAYARLGEADLALGHLNEVLSLTQLVNARRGEAFVRTAIGLVHLDTGEFGEARAHFERALAISRELDDIMAQSLALSGLGRVRAAEGSPALALTFHDQALELSGRTAHPMLECHLLNDLADTHDAMDDHGRAAELRRGVLSVATRIEAGHELARARRGLT